MPEGRAIEIDDTVNDTVKKHLVQIIQLLQRQPGIRISALTKKFDVSEITIKRDMQKIRPLVVYKGSPKNGGYFLTDYMLSKLN